MMFVEISDRHVLLRSFQRGDKANLYQAIRESLPEFSRWMSWCHEGYSLAESEAWIKSRAHAWQSGSAYSFAIVDARDDSFVGGCSLSAIHPVYRFANLGYWVRTSRTGEGFATAATRLLADFGFRQLRLNRIEIVIAVGNLPSLRVAEKVGATCEGVLRNRIVIGNELYDAVMFSLIPGEQ